ncbi:MAG: hypothetical protein ACFFE4_05800 [Candidatus Thorarchaeota archaeon]
MDLSVLIVLLVALIGLIVGIISYKSFKNIRKKRAVQIAKLHNLSADALNLEYVLILEKKSGLTVYSQHFSEKEIRAEMISELFRIINSLGIEPLNAKIINLEHTDSILVICDFVNIRLILLMRESPSKYFLYQVEELAYAIYKTYGALIDTFEGDVNSLKGIGDLLKHYLPIPFIYPLKLAKIDKLAKISLTQHERELIDKAVQHMKSNNRDYFNVSSLIPEKIRSAKDLEVLLSLLDKGVFKLTQETKDRLREFFRKFRGSDDEHFPYPYIFTPPTPPKEAGAEAQLKPEYIAEKHTPEIPYCKYCGAVLPRGALICHVCGQKI